MSPMALIRLPPVMILCMVPALSLPVARHHRWCRAASFGATDAARKEQTGSPQPRSRPMTTARSDFLRTLDERGFIHQCSDMPGLDALAAKGEVIAYVGYDCTAPSLHVGSLLSIMMLHWLQVTGAGKPIVLMGGGTTRVGDPSGKDETRQLRSLEEIESNKRGM